MKPPRRFRAPFLPVTRPPAGERCLIGLEKVVKGALFDCSMCGNCLLQETAFICPMLCPKGLRNGPCGSGTSTHCCVDPDRPCVWHLIYQRAEELGRLDRLLEVQAPLDWSRTGRETWATVVRRARQLGLLSPLVLRQRTAWRPRVERMFREVRQPDWWQGDAVYHPPAQTGPASSLQAALQHGEFVVTAEVMPPRGASVEKMLARAAGLQGRVHAANVTDNAMATPRMSSLTCCTLLQRQGLEPILQLTARDYNRMVLQSEALGASALGVHNVLCLTGDPPTAGPEPASGLPFDLDAIQMLWILRRLRDEGHFLDGRPVSRPPSLFLGAAGSPNDADPHHEALRLEKKINAGAQFIQTQLVYDVERLQGWLDALDGRDLLDKVDILVGIGPLRSVKTTRYLAGNVPGITLPPQTVRRMEQSSDPAQAGLEIALEIIEQVKVLPGVAGIHLMAVGWESVLPELIERAGLIEYRVA